MIVVAIVLLIVLLAISIPVAAVLGLLGLSLNLLYSGAPLYRALGEIAWTTSTNPVLVAIPLFILQGELMFRSGIADRMYRALGHWLTWLPGSVLHTNIGACTLFSATSGSSVATAATMTTVALPQAKNFGYNERLFLGTITAGGTLGILIPPSINLIIYGALTNTSVPKLYLAAVVPGLMIAFLFSVMIVVACLLKPEWGGERRRSNWHDRIVGLPHLIAPLIIFAVVLGSIYTGWATPTESAALGLACVTILTMLSGHLTLSTVLASIEGAMKTTAMIMLLTIAAYFLNFILGSLGMVRLLENFVDSLGTDPFLVLLMVLAFYLLLGMVLDTLSLMIVTTPIIAPVIIGLGYDPIWFGIVFMVLIEIALITPPVGMNLFVVQSVRQRGSIADVIIGALPFVVALLIGLALLVAFPQIVLFIVS